MNAVSILVPYAPAGPEREAAWLWNRHRLRYLLPKALIVTGSPDLIGDPGLFSRALALNRAAAEALGDLLLIVDADTTYAPADFHNALTVAATGAWTLPERYVRLSRRATDDWMLTGPTSSPPADWEDDLEQEYPFANSGVVAMPREAFEAVGGFDERFRGWGGEDDAIRAALETLWVPPTRLGIAYHLWHPRPPEHSTANPHNAAQRVLSDRYGAASGDLEAMRDLLAERALGSGS